jgi:hypothetical protein
VGDDETFDSDVAVEVRKLRSAHDARRRVDEENTIESPPFDADLLADVLARPAEPPHRVDELIPVQAGTLVVAQRKTGKTTLELNLARVAAHGRDFWAGSPSARSRDESGSSTMRCPPSNSAGGRTRLASIPDGFCW